MYWTSVFDVPNLASQNWLSTGHQFLDHFCLSFISMISWVLNVDSDGLLFEGVAKIFQKTSCKEDFLILQDDIANLENWSDLWMFG